MHMNMASKTIRYSIQIIAFLVVAFIIMSFINDNNERPDEQKRKLNYNGTYGLYVKKTDHFNFRWITQSEDIGYYEVISKANNKIASGETASSRTHSINLEKKMEGPFTFKFGGKKGTMHEVKIRKNFEKDKTSYKKVDSLYVVGDIHGRYDQLTILLIKSKIIDKELNWIAGKSHIVFLGDVFDRGNDVIKVLWFIYGLEEKAALAGGRVHLVLGNHEIMTMTNDLRYVNRKELNIAIAHRMGYDELFHPIDSYLGSWLRSKVSVLKIDKVVFAHGGILDIGPISLDEFNNKAYYYMQDPMYVELMKEYPDSTKYDPDDWYDMRYFFYNSEGPYWFRGYVNSDTLSPQLNSMLNKFNSKIHVVAHTTVETITERYDGKLLTTDLDDAATELLLLVRNKNKYKRYKIDSEGLKSEL